MILNGRHVIALLACLAVTACSQDATDTAVDDNTTEAHHSPGKSSEWA